MTDSEGEPQPGELLAALGPTILSGLIAALRHEDADARRIAVVNLGRMGEYALESASELSRTMRDDSELELRVLAAAALAGIGARALPWLLPGLASAEVAVRTAAHDALATLGLSADAALRSLCESLDDGDPNVRLRALLVLSDLSMGRLVIDGLDPDADVMTNIDSAATRALGASESLTRILAVDYLWRMHRDHACGDAIVAIARDDNDPQQSLAADVLRYMGRPIPRAVPAENDRDASPIAPVLTRISTELEAESTRGSALDALRFLAREGFRPAFADEAVQDLLETESDGFCQWVATHLVSQAPGLYSHALPALVAAARSASDSTRRTAIEGLARLRPVTADALNALQRALHDSDEYVRNEAVRALKSLGEAARPAIPALRTMRQIADESLRLEVEEALLSIGTDQPSMPLTAPRRAALLQRLGDADEVQRAWAAAEFSHATGLDVEVIRALFRLLGDDRMLVRASAAEALRRHAESVRRQVLVDLADSDAAMRHSAAAAVIALRAPFSAAVEPLLHALSKEEPPFRCTWPALERLGGAALPQVRQAILSESQDVEPLLNLYRNHAAELQPFLSHPSERVRLCALRTLYSAWSVQRAGRALELCQPDIIRLADDPSHEIRFEAVRLLYRSEKSAEVVAALIRRIDDTATDVRREALERLSRWQAEPEVVVPRLVELLDTDDSFARNTFIQLLESYGSAAAAAVPVILDHLDDWSAPHALSQIEVAVTREIVRRVLDDPTITEQCVEVLRTIRPAPEFVADVMSLLESRVPAVRNVAAGYLGRLRNDASPAVATLADALQIDDPTDHEAVAACVACVEALGRIGTASQPALSKMVPLCNSEHDTLREAAQLAVKRIERGSDDRLKDPDRYERWMAAWDLWYGGNHSAEIRQTICETFDDAARHEGLESVLYQIRDLEPLDAAMAELFLSYCGHSYRKAREAAESGLSHCISAERQYWQDRLDDVDAMVRQRAAEELGQHFPTTRLVERLKLALTDESPNVRRQIVRAVKRMAMCVEEWHFRLEADLRTLLEILATALADANDGVSAESAAVIAAVRVAVPKSEEVLREIAREESTRGRKLSALLSELESTSGIQRGQRDATTEEWLDEMTDKLSGVE